MGQDPSNKEKLQTKDLQLLLQDYFKTTLLDYFNINPMENYSATSTQSMIPDWCKTKTDYLTSL